MELKRLREAVFGNKERVVTGVAMVVVLGVILALNNFYLIWTILGLAYVVAVYEVIKLFGLKDSRLFIVLSILVWLGTLFVKDVIF